MSLLLPFKKKQDSYDEGASIEEIKQHHRYGADLVADGFVSPITTPHDRLMELKGRDSVVAMAERAKLPTRELDVLISNEYLEPTVRQLLVISLRYKVSVFWLLGYHTKKQVSTFDSDKAILAAISKRNGAEQALRLNKKKGFLSDFYRFTAEKRVRKFNLAVANTAAHLIAYEHLPLSEEELYLLIGQPVYIEYLNNKMEWGLVTNDGIITRTETLYINECGGDYQAYQTPDFAVTDFKCEF